MDVDSLPDLSQDYEISTDQPEQYQRDGHILLRGVCSPEEIAAFHPVIGSATGRFNRESRPLEERDTYGKAFLQVVNLWERDEAVKRYSLARRFAGIAARLMGVPAVRIYHDQALYKEPGGGPTPWHQDQFYWPLDTPKTITMWMPLVDVPIEKGALTFASGSHHKGREADIEISDKSDEIIRQLVERENYPVAVEAMREGDATFHSGWTLHKAPGNQTSELREVMTVIYYEDGALVTEPKSSYQKLDMETFFPGCAPGERAASHLNPVVYSSK